MTLYTFFKWVEKSISQTSPDSSPETKPQKNPQRTPTISSRRSPRKSQRRIPHEDPATSKALEFGFTFTVLPVWVTPQLSFTKHQDSTCNLQYHLWWAFCTFVLTYTYQNFWRVPFDIYFWYLIFFLQILIKKLLPRTYPTFIPWSQWWNTF